ncbi:MAG: acyl-CoA dehydrogenase family protein [Vicingaceae bacterium]
MEKEAIKGGEFLIRETDPKDIFIPEEWDEEQQMISATCEEFIKKEVLTQLDEIDSLKEGLMPSLMKKAGELGMLGISIPEDLGGFGKDFNTSMLSAEKTGAGHSFSVAISAHTGIGTLPILYYGNADQKQKYIPKLASGEWLASYCLTEPGSGSDANGARTKAVLSPDGKHYILNGQKMWITNGGFADVYTVFAKIDDDDNMSAFIVERNFEGLSLNTEEKKMGIKGSSTVQVFLNDCKVPVENLLSDRGNGFKIALNILNIGRIKLATATLGASKDLITKSVMYANERNQFGRPISKYGAIRYKLAEQAIRTFALESASYRCGKNITDQKEYLLTQGKSDTEALLKGVEEFAIEAAILKVYGSETLDYVVDEGVQIFGGMGYSAEAPMERAYRDSRINRIFEGTNEINRMLSVDMILKRAMKGQLDLMPAVQAVASELASLPSSEKASGDYASQKEMVANFKKAVLVVAGKAVEKLMQSLAKEQEVLMNIANMLMDVYVAESLLLRVMKLDQRGQSNISVYKDMLNIFLVDAADRINKQGKDAIASYSEGDELRMLLMGLKRFTKYESINVVEARRNIAAMLIDKNAYCF